MISTTNKEVMAVVKADAYEHGALDVAPCLLENGASRLAVAMLLKQSNLEIIISQHHFLKGKELHLKHRVHMRQLLQQP